MNDNNSLQPNGYYKNLNKHGNCSKCNIVLTQDNYKKGRTVCRMCYNNNVLSYYKNNFSDSSLKTDACTQTDFLDECDTTNNKIISKKRNNPIKKIRPDKKDNRIIQECSDKQI